MRTRVDVALSARSRGLFGILAALMLTLFVASPSWAVTYGSVSTTAPTTPSCSLSGKTYTCAVSGTGTYTGVKTAPVTSGYLEVEVWRCPTTVSTVAVNGVAPSGCTREALIDSNIVSANCSVLCVGSTKAAGTPTCTVTASYNYFTRAIFWLTSGTLATGTTSVTKNVKGC